MKHGQECMERGVQVLARDGGQDYALDLRINNIVWTRKRPPAVDRYCVSVSREPAGQLLSKGLKSTVPRWNSPRSQYGNFHLNALTALTQTRYTRHGHPF